MQPNFIQEKIEISGKKFLINKWGPTKFYKNIGPIGRYFAVPLGIMYGGGDVKSLSEAVPTALVYLFNQMEESDIMDFFKLVLEDVHYQGQPIANQLESIFQSDPEDIIELVAKVLEVNYKGFFQKKGLGSLLNILSPLSQAQEAINPIKD